MSIGTCRSSTFSPDQPPAWATYIATKDVDATVKADSDAGGQTVVEPLTVMDAGRMAVFTDNAGAHFCVWQPGTHRGAAFAVIAMPKA